MKLLRFIYILQMALDHGFSERTSNFNWGLREKRQSTLRPLNLSYVSDQIDRKLTQIIHEKARLLIKIQNFMTLSDHKKGLVYVSNWFVWICMKRICTFREAIIRVSVTSKSRIDIYLWQHLQQNWRKIIHLVYFISNPL